MESNVKVRIDAIDTTKAAFASVQKNLEQIEKSTTTFRQRLENLQPAFQQMAFAGAASLTAIGAGANVAIKNATALGESINAVNVVFGDASSEILKFGENSARTVGLSTAAFNQMATMTGALLKDTGMSMDQVALSTNELSIRAADLASVFNTDVADAASAINQALRGETEAIRRYTGDVTDATLQNYLLAQGIQTSVTELTEQEKRYFRLKLIMEQTAFAAGDFDRTSGELANTQRILAAEATNVSATIGKQLVPIMQTALSAIAPFIEKLGQWVQKNPELTRTIVIFTAATAAAVLAVGALGIAISVLMSPVTLAVAAIAALTGAVYLVTVRWQQLPIALKAVLLPVKLLVEGLKLLYSSVMWVADGVSNLWNKAMGQASTSAAATNASVIDLQGTVDKFVDPLAGQSVLVDDFTASIGSVGTKASETADKIAQLKAEAQGIFGDVAKNEADSKRQLAEAIVEQEEGISEKKKELRRLERAEDTDANASRIRELRNTIREEEAALRNANDIRTTIRAEIDEAERRASLSAFERKVEDIQRERIARLEAKIVRLQEIEVEIAAEKRKSGAIAGAFTAAQNTMQSAIKATSEVAETEAERMKRAFDRAISSMNQLSGGGGSRNLFVSTSKTLAGRAVGGPVSRNTPYIVGEVGPELFVPNQSGSIISNNRLAGVGGGNITINVSGTFLDDRTAGKRVADAVMRELKLNTRL